MRADEQRAVMHTERLIKLADDYARAEPGLAAKVARITLYQEIAALLGEPYSVVRPMNPPR